MPLDKSRIEALLAAAVRELEGEWLLVGGAAAALWFAPGRVTEDVDLIALGGTQGERLALLELADRQGYPPEAVNSTADFFVRRVADWRTQLEPLLVGPRMTVFRPTVTLFLLLKIARLTEKDLEDCLTLLDHANERSLSWDVDRIRAAVDALPSTDDASLASRRATLRAALEEPT